MTRAFDLATSIGRKHGETDHDDMIRWVIDLCIEDADDTDEDVSYDEWNDALAGSCVYGKTTDVGRKTKFLDIVHTKLDHGEHRLEVISPETENILEAVQSVMEGQEIIGRRYLSHMSGKNKEKFKEYLREHGYVRESDEYWVKS